MKNLLTNKENRRLKFVELLTTQNDWIILAELSALLQCSTRVLKNDIVALNETFDDFIIHTSIYGVRIEYMNHRTFRLFCQKVLSQSNAYQLLELIFLNENITIQSISHQLNISLSTLYRLIDDLNIRLKEEHGFYIQKGLSRLVGSEKNIRRFFCTYFLEKDIHICWPFKEVDENSIDLILRKIISMNNLPATFVSYDVIKVIFMVNYTRYAQGSLIVSDYEHIYTDKFLPSPDKESDFYTLAEDTFKTPYNEEFVNQVLDQFVQKGIFYSYKHFIKITLADKKLASQSRLLHDILNEIALKNDLPLASFEEVELALFNLAHLEYQDPQSNYILYNHSGQFADEIQSEFPAFYKDLYNGMKLFRAEMNKPLTEDGMNYYIIIIFIWWKNLIPELRRKRDKIRILVVSDRPYSHAQMLKDFLAFEFSEQLEVDIFEEPIFDPDILKTNAYELVVGSYTSQSLHLVPNVYISHLPKTEDYLKIQEHIDQILFTRLKNKEKKP